MHGTAGTASCLSSSFSTSLFSSSMGLSSVPYLSHAYYFGFFEHLLSVLWALFGTLLSSKDVFLNPLPSLAGYVFCRLKFFQIYKSKRTRIFWICLLFSVLKFSDSTDVCIPKNATVAELKVAVEEVFASFQKEISW